MKTFVVTVGDRGQRGAMAGQDHITDDRRPRTPGFQLVRNLI